METQEIFGLDFFCEWSRGSSQPGLEDVAEKGFDVCTPFTASSWRLAPRDSKGHCMVASTCAWPGQLHSSSCFHPFDSSSSSHFFLVDQTCWYHMHLLTAGWPFEDTPCLVQMRISCPWRRQEDCMALKISAVREVNPLDSWSILPRSRSSFEYFSDSLANLCWAFLFLWYKHL